MASTYTSNSGIELIATGEKSGTWGDTTNVNLQIIDRLTNGVGAISLSGTTHTITTSDGALSDGHYAVLVFGGAPGGANTVTISPNDQQKVFFVKNESGENVILSQGSGSTVTVANGNGAIVYTDGAGSGASVVDLTSVLPLSGSLIAANNLSDVPDKPTARLNMGVGVGVDVQAYNAKLQAIANLTPSDGAFVVGNGSTFVAESGATALASLGITATASELNYLDIAVPGLSGANKALTSDANGDTLIQSQLQSGVYLETGGALSGTSVAIPCSAGNFFTITTSGNTTFTFDYSGINLTLSEVYVFALAITAGGTHSLTFPLTVKWPGGADPIPPSSGETDVFVFFTVDSGSSWYGFQAGDALA